MTSRDDYIYTKFNLFQFSSHPNHNPEQTRVSGGLCSLVVAAITTGRAARRDCVFHTPATPVSQYRNTKTIN